MSIDGRPPAMTDVARLANVSHQTVSRVLNGNARVRPETRARVVQAIEQLQYRRNLAARALVTNRTQLLGVVAFGTTLYGPASTLNGIEHAAGEAGYAVIVVSVEEGTRETFARAIDVLTGHSPDGIIVIAPTQAAVDALDRVPPGLAAVAVEGGQGTARVPVVCIDQVAGARLATEHLLELGHRTVHHLAGPADWLEAERREWGWRHSLEVAGAAVTEPIRGDWSARSGYEAGLRIVDQREVTAVFVANDQMALGLLCALSAAGIRVPEDVSVVGFDDVPEAEFFGPPLTTVAQEFSDVGRSSLATLLTLIDGEVPKRRLVLPPRLVVRSSTSRAAKGRGQRRAVRPAPD